MKTLDELVSDHAALLAPRDLPGEWTPAERDAYEGRRSALDGRLRTAREAQQILNEWKPRLDTALTYKARVDDVREKLCQELTELVRPRDDHEFGLQVNTRLSIVVVDRGESLVDGTGWCLATLRLGVLLREANVEWAGSLPDVERRVAEAKQRCDDAKARLDNALLDDEERRIADAEAKARRDAFNAMTKAERKAAHNKKCGYAVDSRGVAIIGGKA
jgi:hypothetical protein